jgi:hypothetical protein
MKDRHHVRIRVDAVLIHSNGKQTIVAQHWADVPLSTSDTIKRNATRAAVEAVKFCQSGAPRCRCCGSDE